MPTIRRWATSLRAISADYLLPTAAISPGETVSGNDSLYYATSPLRWNLSPAGEDDNKTRLVEFASSHYDVSVEVAIPRCRNECCGRFDADAEICGVSPCTDFENRACGGDGLSARNRIRRRQQSADRTPNIMRHTDHSRVGVCLRSPDGRTLLAEVNLAEFLAGAGHRLLPTRVLIPMHGIRIEVVVTVPE